MKKKSKVNARKIMRTKARKYHSGTICAGAESGLVRDIVIRTAQCVAEEHHSGKENQE
jgi:hypothetical protein